MRKTIRFLFVLLLAFFAAVGCSSSRHNPITPEKPLANPDLPVVVSDGNTENHSLLGLWSIDFDIENHIATLTPDRSPETHYNATSLIPPPEIIVNSYDPASHVIDVDVTLTNPFNVDVYDVRGIVFVDAVFHYLLNPDNWTPLYDIPSGYPVNPFRAFAKSIPNRKFAAHSQQTENFQIYLPQGNTNVQFAIDASYPGNCEEPYLIENFSQDNLFEYAGSSTTATVYAYDWQDNVNHVSLYCPEITNQDLVPFQDAGSNKWELELVNNRGAGVGDYTGWIIAKSSDSANLALYDMVTIKVISPLPNDPQLVGALYGCNLVKIAAVMDNIVYFRGNPDSDNDWGIPRINITDLQSPEMLDEIPLGSCDILWRCGTPSIEIRGSYAYYIWGVAYNPWNMWIWSYNISIMDISNPSAPEEVFHYPLYNETDETGGTVYLYNNYMYIIKNLYTDYTLMIFDVADPTNAQLLNEIPIAGGQLTRLKNGFLFTYGDVSLEESRIYIYDINDPVHPDLISSFVSDSGSIKDFILYNNLAILSDSGSIKVYDISDPTAVELIGSIYTGSAIYGIAASDGFVYTTGKNAGLRVIDIRVPHNPTLYCTLNDSRIYGDVAVQDNYAYVGAGPNGFFVIKLY